MTPATQSSKFRNIPMQCRGWEMGEREPGGGGAAFVFFRTWAPRCIDFFFVDR